MEGTVTLKDSAQSMEITDFICKDFLEILLTLTMAILISCRQAKSLRWKLGQNQEITIRMI
jgi:hypothetical protein